LYAIGRTYLVAGDEVQAQAYFEKALKSDPFHARSALAMAKLYSFGAHVDKAMEMARRVLAIEEPGSPLATEALTVMEKVTGADPLAETGRGGR
jgi:tetratricopeptide (TPR) repeat protein